MVEMTLQMRWWLAVTKQRLRGVSHQPKHQWQWQWQGVALASRSRDPAQPWPVPAPVMVLGQGVGHQPLLASRHFPHLVWVPCHHMPCCYLLSLLSLFGNYVDGPSVIGSLKWSEATEQCLGHIEIFQSVNI